MPDVVCPHMLSTVISIEMIVQINIISYIVGPKENIKQEKIPTTHSRLSAVHSTSGGGFLTRIS